MDEEQARADDGLGLEWAVPGVDRDSALTEGVELLHAGLAVLREVGAAGWCVGDIAVRDGVRDLDSIRHQVEHLWLGLVHELDRRPAAVPGTRVGGVAHGFLTGGLNRSPGQARRDVAAARSLFRADPDCPDADSRDPESAGPQPDEEAAQGQREAALTHPRARLSALGELLEAGQVSREHLDAAVDCLQNVPRRLARAVDEETGLSGTGRVDAFMADKARQFDPRILRRLAKHLLAVLDPDGQKSGFDPDAYLRRGLRLTEASDGMTLIRGQVDAAAAVWLRAALDHFSSPERNPRPDRSDQGSPDQGGPDQGGSDEGGSDEGGSDQGGSDQGGSDQGELPVGGTDERTPTQRQADALIALARRALDSDDSNVRREPAHVLILTNPEQLADAHTRTARAPGGSSPDGSPPTGTPPATAAFDRAVGLAEIAKIGPVPPDVLALLTCDALLQAVVLNGEGAVLQMDLGNTRTASRSQRRALAARDRGCIYPGCPAKPADCDAHHIRFWSAGGRTTLVNLGLFCGRHHTEVHLGLFTVTMINGVPQVQVPDWHAHAVHERSSPSRNRLHDAITRAQRLAQQLRLDLDAEEERGLPPGTRAA